MTKYISAINSDLTQKLSRQINRGKRSSASGSKNQSDDYAVHRKQPLRVKEKYKTWANEIDDNSYDDDEDDYTSV